MKASEAFRLTFGSETITDAEIDYVIDTARDELNQYRGWFECYLVDVVRLARQRHENVEDHTVTRARAVWQRALGIARRLREKGPSLHSLEAHMFVRQTHRPLASVYPKLLVTNPVADYRYLVKKDGKIVKTYKMKAQAIAFVDGCVLAGVKQKRLEITEKK